MKCTLLSSLVTNRDPDKSWTATASCSGIFISVSAPAPHIMTAWQLQAPQIIASHSALCSSGGLMVCDNSSNNQQVITSHMTCEKFKGKCVSLCIFRGMTQHR